MAVGLLSLSGRRGSSSCGDRRGSPWIDLGNGDLGYHRRTAQVPARFGGPGTRPGRPGRDLSPGTVIRSSPTVSASVGVIAVAPPESPTAVDRVDEGVWFVLSPVCTSGGGRAGRDQHQERNGSQQARETHGAAFRSRESGRAAEAPPASRPRASWGVYRSRSPSELSRSGSSGVACARPGPAATDRRTVPDPRPDDGRPQRGGCRARSGPTATVLCVANGYLCRTSATAPNVTRW
jgi:hypothetical protein